MDNGRRDGSVLDGSGESEIGWVVLAGEERGS